MMRSPIHTERGKRRPRHQSVCLLILALIALLIENLTACATTATTVETLGQISNQSTQPTHVDVHQTASSVLVTVTECIAVAQCLSHADCAQCLAALNSTTRSRSWDDWKGMGGPEARENDKGIFRTLQLNSSCATDDSLILLHPALLNLSRPQCTDLYGMFADPCMVAENACFDNTTCRGCLNAIYNGSPNTASIALDSPSCMASHDQLYQMSGAGETFVCRAFPRCTFFKQQCGVDPMCRSCLTLMSGGHGQEAAQQCDASTAPATYNGINSVVFACSVMDTAGCSFWHERCSNNDNCTACLGNISNAYSIHEIALATLSTGCQRVLRDATATLYLYGVLLACRSTTRCQQAVANCVNDHQEACLVCLLGATPRDASCERLTRYYGFGSLCQPCPDSIRLINYVVLATSVVGGISAAMCILVVMTILAHRRDLFSMRDRIIVGLMMANTVYSIANILPLNAVNDGYTNCGELALSFDAVRFGRAWWFGGKYALVAFELMILASSIRPLVRATASVSVFAEMTMHVGCIAIGCAAFAVFYALCYGINEDGYNQ